MRSCVEALMKLCQMLKLFQWIVTTRLASFRIRSNVYWFANVQSSFVQRSMCCDDDFTAFVQKTMRVGPPHATPAADSGRTISRAIK